MGNGLGLLDERVVENAHDAVASCDTDASGDWKCRCMRNQRLVFNPDKLSRIPFGVRPTVAFLGYGQSHFRIAELVYGVVRESVAPATNRV